MSDELNINEHFKITNIVYFALISGQMFFLIIAIFIIEKKSVQPVANLDSFFIIIIPVFGIIMMYLSRIIYNNNLSKSDPSASIKIKLGLYRTFKIISWAQIEAATMFSLVAFILTSNYLYLVVFAFLIGFFFMIRSSKENFVRDMKLPNDEVEAVLRRN